MRFLRSAGFSLVELLIAVSIVGILASVGVVNTMDVRARARDANRKSSVDGYAVAMNLYKGSRGTTFVYSSKNGGCNAASTCTDADLASLPKVSWDNQSFIRCDGSGCVGFYGGGWGMMTRRGVANYTSTSLADALVQDGFLIKVLTDPRTSTFTDDARTAAAFSDFVLVTCTSTATAPAAPSQAVAYAIFANLERPQQQETADAMRHCGGPSTPNGGWNILAQGGDPVDASWAYNPVPPAL